MKKLSVIISIVLTGFCIAEVGQELQNGTFDANLDGWTTEPVDTDAVVWFQDQQGTAAAVLLNPDDFPLDSTWPFQESFAFLSAYPQPTGNNIQASYLYQAFTLSENADKLSFDTTMEVYSRTEMGETDVLTVTLWHGPDFAENQRIYRISSTDVEYYTDPEDCLVNESDIDEFTQIWTHHVIYNTPVDFDISPWSGQDVLIEFELSHDNDDDIITTATIDDVAVSTAGDTTPPAVMVGEMAELWPPNHKYHTFNLSDIVLSVGDDQDGEIDIDEASLILSIYSDEPEDVKSKGDGSTLDDIVILGTSSFKVRSERQGTGNGRVYGITFEVFDSSGNSTVETVYLGVPHDKSGKIPIEDDGSEAGYVVQIY